MKGKLFLLTLIAALSFSMLQAQVKMENVVKTANFSHQVTKQALNARYLNVPTLKAPARADIPAGYAMVTLSAGDIWSDGTGYQMLLDADANAYGTIIPETGALTTGGDVPASIYAEFEYKIPENADGALATTNIVFNADVSILVPVGVYDWCITNPTPGDRMWISSDNGPIPGRYDDFEFVEGMTYVFTISVYGSNDGVDLTVLEPGVSLTTPVSVTVEPAATSATVNWEDNDDILWNIRYRVHNPNEGGFWDFEDDSQLEGWVIYDADGDGDNWYYNTSCDMANSGTCVLASDSYYWGALYPDNWLISPEVALNGELSFYATGSASSWYEEVFCVYVGPSDWTSIDEFTPISEDITTGYGMQKYTFDVSSRAGEKGVFAIRHYNCSDVYTLYVDDIAIGEPGNEWITINGIDDLNAVLENLDPETTYEVQVQATGNAGFSSEWSETVTFTTLADDPIVPPVDQVGAPTFEGYSVDGITGYGVHIIPTTEGSEIMYRVFVWDDENNEWTLLTDWALYEGTEGEIYMTEINAKYRVEAYAFIGQVQSMEVAYEFVVTPPTGINEMNAGKTVAGVRYFNMAGQEMQQADGLTIVVTTYTDGTTSAAKVVK